MRNSGQASRVMAAVEAEMGQSAPLCIDAALDTFRRNWNRNRMTGIRQDLSLPPLDHAQVREALDAVLADYWGARTRAAFGEDRALLDATRGALLAAHARHRAERGKRPAGAELRAVLRKRDGSDCWVCGHDLGEDATIEHKIALANGGTWALDNLTLAHGHCNRALGCLPLAAKEAARAALKEARNG